MTTTTSVTEAPPVAREKTEGIHYTPPRLACYVAKKIIEISQLPQDRPVRVLDPACGDGELLVALTTELVARGHAVRVVGFDIDARATATSTQRVTAIGGNIEVDMITADFLAHRPTTTTNPGAELGGSMTLSGSFDIVIANPPYVRTQHLGAKRSQELARKFGLSGRIDLYQAFIASLESVLKQGGTFGLIVPNRFLVTQGGARTRSLLASAYSIESIIDLGDTRQFAAAVLPALVFGRNSPSASQTITMASIYSTDIQPDPDILAASVYEALDSGTMGTVRTPDGTWTINRGALHAVAGAAMTSPWVARRKESADLVERVESATWATFATLGKIRVGIKTTADKIFIRRDWDALGKNCPEASLLHPMISSDTVQRWAPAQSALRVLYPYDMGTSRRTPLDLSSYPRARTYFEHHREVLAKRQYVIEAGRNWWEIWVPQRPSEWSAPKIVFPDISTDGRFSVDRSGAIVNGNCYWISVAAGQDDLAYLAIAVGNSSLAMRYYDAKFGNKLYAGRRRFISQYVSQFPLPDPTSDQARRAIALARRIESLPVERQAIEEELDACIWSAFGLEKP